MRECVTLGPNDRTCSPLTPSTLFPLGSLCAAVVTEPACFPLLLHACALLPNWVPLVVVAPPELEASLEAYLTAFDLPRAGQSTIMVSHSDSTSTTAPRPRRSSWPGGWPTASTSRNRMS